MEWYWWIPIIWLICGAAALVMEFRDDPAMRENVGLKETWRVILGPLWLAVKVWQWAVIGRTN